MTIRVTARHDDPVGDVSAVKVLRPKGARVIPEESQEETLVFTVPEGRKNLVYELPPLEGTTEPRHYATKIPPGRARFRFEADKSARQQATGEVGARAQETARESGPTAPGTEGDREQELVQTSTGGDETGTEGGEELVQTTTGGDETGTEAGIETEAEREKQLVQSTTGGQETEQEVGLSTEGVTGTTQQLDTSQLHWVKQQISLALSEVYDDFSDALDHMKQNEIEPLRQELHQHLTQHAPIPTTPTPETPEPETPTTLEAAIDLAVDLTTDVRDGFTTAADAFATRLGLGLEGGGATAADRTLKQLRLAASAADSAIARYEALPAPSPGNEEFAVVAFVAEVRTAGEFYATTVARVAEAATRTGDPGEEAAYDQVAQTLGDHPTGTAIDGLRRFDVDTAPVTSNRRRFTS